MVGSVPADVAIYTTNYCPYCTRAKALLGKKGVPFTEIAVDDRADLRAWVAAASKQRTVPQIFINGQAVGGFTDIAALDQKGVLDEMLGRAPASGDPEIRR